MAPRPLTPSEIAEARLVFGPGLDYTRARVHESARWTDWVDGIGVFLQRGKRGVKEHNAITLGNVSYFPVPIRTDEATVLAGDLRDMSWLIHELTHQWQFQRWGWRYLYSALHIQLREGRRSYNYQREHPTRQAALKAARKDGRKLIQFNAEQQGDIARDFYYALKRGEDCSPWEPFVQELR
jgi:hypothetical protein